MSVSVAWLLYALHIYYKRVRSIRAGDMAGFGETFGPTMIVMGLILLCVGSMAVSLYQPFSAATTTTTTTILRPINQWAGAEEKTTTTHTLHPSASFLSYAEPVTKQSLTTFLLAFLLNTLET